MDKHKHHEHPEPQYWVMAEVCEPDYEAEMKFIEAELKFVKRKMTKRRQLSVPAWGFFGRDDWRRYAHELERYEQHLAKYCEEVEAGLLPVKFTVYNAAELADTGVHIKVKVADGRIDEAKKVPVRPTRLDAGGKPLKFKLPRLSGFSRSGIKITPHAVHVRFSALGPQDGAVLINQTVHLHCEPETAVVYQISSRNVAHEVGDVELVEREQSAHSPASST